MEKPKSSYTEEELKKFEQYMKRHPNAPYWTTLDRKVIPYVFIKDDHLDNIIKHLEERYAVVHRQVLLITIAEMKELKRRRLSKSLAGKILYASNTKKN